MTEPVSLDQLKVHLRLDPSDTSEDDYLTTMITAARRACEYQINRSVVGTSATKKLDAFPGQHRHRWATSEQFDRRLFDIPLDGGLVQSVDSIAYLDSTGASNTLDPATYVVDLDERPARVAPVDRWPLTGHQPGAVTIAYTVSPLDDDDFDVVSQAMLLTLGHWFKNREAVAVDVRGAPIELPLSVTWLLQPLRQWATE